jgi:hypothetical protein
MGFSPTFLVSSWEDCEQKLREIEAENTGSHSGVWFRGLPDATWPLTTTLERRREQVFEVGEYYKLMIRTLPDIEAFTEKTWLLPNWSAPERDFAKYFREMPAFGYMAHLRHHGFPSPLLDWSRSPYVAAYFAFAGASSKSADKVAIFAYSETPNNTKVTISDQPHICSHGGMALRTHIRHFRQQSCYTVCVERPNPDRRWRFASHEKVFESCSSEQDKLYKIEIPSTERIKVLRLFDRYNLNDLSLFGSDESLMETLAFRLIDSRD